MIEVRELNSNGPATILRGHTFATIARRLYGRRAWVQYNGESVRNRFVAGYVRANVLVPTRDNPRVHMVMATWLIDVDDYEQADEEE